MPNYYWVGATAGVGIERFDYNRPSNWKVERWGSNPSSWPTGASAPGNGDIIFFGAAFTAQSPCLYGGYSGQIGSGQWRNYNGLGTNGITGGTSSSSLVNANLFLNSDFYPFPYFGGGITGAIQNYCVNSLGLSAGEITGSTAHLARNGLTLKVSGRVHLTTSGKKSSDFGVGGVDASGNPNYTIANIKFVTSKHNSGGPLGPYSTTQMIISGGITPSSATSGTQNMFRAVEKAYSAVGHGNITIKGGGFKDIDCRNDYFSGSTGATSPSMRSVGIRFEGVTAASINTVHGDILVDQTSTIGTFSVRTSTLPFLNTEYVVPASALLPDELTPSSAGTIPSQLMLMGKYDTAAANTFLGWNTSTTASSHVSGIFLYGQYTVNPMLSAYDYIPTALIGTPIGSTTVAQNFIVTTDLSQYTTTTEDRNQKGWSIEFVGASDITQMSVEGSTVRGNKNTPAATRRVKIDSLALSESSILQFGYAQNISDWAIGVFSGSGQSANIIGGINFGDDSTRVYGATNIRFYNTKVLNNYDFRTQSQISFIPVLGEPIGEGGFAGGKG